MKSHTPHCEITYTTLANSSIGTVEVGISGNANASKCIAIITGIHPRETLSIDPEIKAAKEFGNDDVKIIHYKVTVTENPTDYDNGRANGEALVHDYVNPDVTSSDADAVIISHSHNPPVTGNETYKSTSAVLVSKPIAQAGYPTFVYEIPEDIWESTSTEKTKELFGLIANYID